MARKRTTRMNGGSWKGFKRFMKKANKFLKKTKLLSRTAGLASKFGVPYVGAVGTAARVAGYGRKRRGGALKLAGQGRRRRGARTYRRKRRRGRGLAPVGGMRRLTHHPQRRSMRLRY